MSLIDIRSPSRREQVVFGLLLALFFGLIGGIFAWQFDSMATARVLWAVGAVLGLAYYAVPRLRLVLYYGWMYLVYPIGWTVSHFVLLVAYYAVLTPIGILLRLMGRDPMHRGFDREADTYWVEHRPAREASRYFQQY